MLPTLPAHGIAGDRIIQVRIASGRTLIGENPAELLRLSYADREWRCAGDGHPWDAKDVALEVKRRQAREPASSAHEDDRFDCSPAGHDGWRVCAVATTSGAFVPTWSSER